MATTTSAYEMDFAQPTNFSELMWLANDQAEKNNARMEAAAERNYQWQEEQNAKAMQFNASQAELSRDWQEYMSNTAHQREIADLKAAGLNPVLSATGGNGASVGSGATASAVGTSSTGSKRDTDTSTIVNLLGNVLDNQTKLEAANVSARSNEAIAEKNNSMSRLIAELNAGVSKYVSDNALRGSQALASANRYSADVQYQIAHDFPRNEIQALATILGDYFGTSSDGHSGKSLGEAIRNDIPSALGFSKYTVPSWYNDLLNAWDKGYGGVKKWLYDIGAYDGSKWFWQSGSFGGSTKR